MLTDTTDQRFSKQIVDTIAKRAGTICSNPDCQAITSGPAENSDRSVNVGEAAHIFGANTGSARFNDGMSPAERSDITNAIWLCRICHKLIDADAPRFPAPLLFEWRRDHEAMIIKRLGKPGDIARQRVLYRELEEFKNCSYRAQQIVIDKPDFWEYKLMAELLRDKLGRVLSRWGALNRGLYTKATGSRLTPSEMLPWTQSRMDELGNIMRAFNELINTELTTSCGPPGKAGSEGEILRACDLLTECCQRILDWEEDVRFVSIPGEFEEVQASLVGIGGQTLDKVAIIPIELSKIFDQEKPAGQHNIHIDIDLPDGWAERIVGAMKAALRKSLG